MLHEPPPEAVVAEAPTTTREETPKPKFDFYSLLPEEEVVVPADTPPEPVQLPPAPQPEAATPAPQPQQAPVAAATPSPATSGDYLVQVGSFRKPDDAERLRAQLAMLGIQTSIQTVTIDNGQTYHRVRTGAYDKSGANAIQSKLKQNGHDSMMMRAQ
jgi:cell division protein FtsN